jgi:exopolysaccharide production protein ExoZ
MWPIRSSPTARPEGRGRLFSLQILRGLAALLVIVAHIKFPLDTIFGELKLPSVVRGAGLACGVDIFFVLSGYVISLTASKGNIGAADFLRRRFTRVFPVYWIASLPFLWRFIASGVESGDLPFRTLWNSAVLLPIFDKFSINDPAHPFGWTLSFEIWFYVAFALLLLVTKDRAGILLPMLAFCVVPISFLWSLSWTFPYFATHPFCLEFALGCIAFQLTQRNLLPRAGAVLLGITGLAVMCVTVDSFEYLGWHKNIRMFPVDCLLRVCVWGVPACFILIGILSTEPSLAARPRLFAGFVLLGEASYSIYLLQPLVFEGITSASPYLHLQQASPLLVSIMILTLTIFVGLIFHWMIEKPLLCARFLKKLTESNPEREELPRES